MKTQFYRLLTAAGLLSGAWLAPNAAAQTLPLEFRQETIRYNLSSTNGLPISTVRGTPSGSDGRGPTLAQQLEANLTDVPATASQFVGLVVFGAVARPGTTNLNPAQSLAANAENLDLPRIKVANQVVMAMLRGRVGAPYLGRSISFRFGELVSRPQTDEYGVLLSSVNTNLTPNRPVTTPEDYWLPEPYTTASHTNSGYYWSPHRQAVFAVNPGPLLVPWRRSVASSIASPPPGVANVFVLGVSYVVATNQYIVSGSPVKPPRLMYWTERSFLDTGKPVTVPGARVGAVAFAYNSNFPERVPTEVVIPGTVPITTSNTLAELRTLWLDDSGGMAGGQIRAYNVEGRMFMELLGDVRTGNNRQHLGFEIVDVIRQPAPNDVTIDLGEVLTAYPPGGLSDADLFPEPLQQLGQSFTFQHNPGGSPRSTYYAVRETVNLNDLQFHWLEDGLQGLKWPFRLVRYQQVWPSDVAKYSHYVRPLVATENEAKATAVPLPAQNAPAIAYQDALDQPRGKLTENFAYYSFLDPEHPAHRALIRFTAGEFVRFERVFSWLDQSLRDGSLAQSLVPNDDLGLSSPALQASVATNLTWMWNPGFVLRNIRANVGVCSLAAADGVLANPAQQATVFSDTAPVVNFLNTGSGGNFGDDVSFPGLAIGVDENNFVMEATGTLLIPRRGLWTFGVNSDDGFRCEIGTNSFEFPAPRAPANTFATFNLEAGRYPVRLVYFECGGGAELEFFAAEGSHAGFNAAFHLVGDIAGGGLGVGFSPASGSVAGAPPVSARPRLVNANVLVGERIGAPVGELGSGLDTNYLAGFIRQSEGDLYHPGAYADPFTAGFAAANHGAIIPVNAVPGRDHLEVWWFRKNEVNVTRGFGNSYWPAVIGRYALQYPTAPAEIVLARNAGSGPLMSLQANGSIYYQNNPAQPGYNPNEEHALVQGGQAFALRDDLNITSTNGFTSLPFVLLDYVEADGRPAVRPFKVLREKPEAGITFDYARTAGTILQAPMPLPLLEKPLAPKVVGQPPKNLNTEIGAYTVSSSARTTSGNFEAHQLTTPERHFAKRFDPLALQDAQNPAAPVWFFPTNISATSLSGWVSDLRPLKLGVWGGSQHADPARWRFTAAIPDGLTAGATPALLYETVGGTHWEITVTEVNTNSQYVELEFASDFPLPARSATLLVLPIVGPAADAFAGQRLASEPLPTTIADATLRSFYGKFTLQDRKGNTWFYRGPHTLTESPSLVMQFYYNTLPGFHFPSLALNAQPPVGTVTPYLRPVNPDGSYEGHPVYGNVAGSAQVADGNALGITYRPVWPDHVPVLQMAETLTTPKRGLPAIRGQTSLEVVYQQSQIVGGEDRESAVLHDPTREKSFALEAAGNATTLDGLPPSVKTSLYQGKTYFPNLPPHLAERFFLDPNRGAFGELVFKGQFVDAALGDKYLFLNVLGQSDLAELQALCVAEDDKKPKWDAAIAGLATTLETFIENPAQPRTYIPSAPDVVGATVVARVKNDDVAVDSYALTATGPGTGYLSLIAGNGRAFTPEGDPVSVQIVKVVDTLYRGEVNLVESSNPLNEKLTLQQVVDLAAKVEDYQFEWLIASPVDGLPPAVYQTARVALMSDGAWQHLRFPLPTDTAASVPATAANRLFQDVATSVAPISRVAYSAVAWADGKFQFATPVTPPHGLRAGNQVTLRKTDGSSVYGMVHPLSTATNVVVSVDPNQNVTITTNLIASLDERVVSQGAQSIVFRQFDQPAGNYSAYWLSLDLDVAVGAVVYLDGQLVVKIQTGQNDSAPSTPPGGLVPLRHAYAVNPAALAGGTLNPDGSRTHTVAVELTSAAYPDQFLAFNVRLEAFTAVDVSAQKWLPLAASRYPEGVRAVLGGSADVQSLADNYLIMRYQPTNRAHASYVPDGGGGNAVWSQWTTPQLAEGWIKRVLKGINPFNQRITDLFNNSVSTDVSIVAQAGARWEGDVALNLDALNDAGLIEIYETVLNRGKLLSIGGGINYGPANDALLLAAGYLNDLYMMLGNEAWADASNPTIGIGTADSTYGDIATAMFSFKGQLPTLLEEELALMRGRDDFLLPGVELRPVYNRLIWNYTRGIDAGEVIYALNYNLLDQNTDGRVDAEDARRLYPQGHGDAYGHYLTALKGYYALLMDNNFDWVPRIEAVTVLGKPVSVDYQDERKFAAAAGGLARAGKQVFDLTWRRDYQAGAGHGWSHFEATRNNSTTRNPGVVTTRYWGLDHWAARTGQGAFFNWVVGNAILPDHDPDPAHAGSIQQIDRTTVPELKELAAQSTSLQTAMDSAEAGHTPLGLPATSIPFDLNPNAVVGGNNDTHFEQIYSRAKRALNNAIVSFDDAKDVTRLMRSEEDSLADFRTKVNQQELAYTNALIELYGTPYPDDIGPGRTYRSGFAGPDTLHYMYVDTKELTFTGPQGTLLDPASDTTWTIDTQTFQPGWAGGDMISTFGWINPAFGGEVDGTGRIEDYLSNTNLYISYTLSAHGFFKKPANWTSQRTSPGRIQRAISDIVKARNAAFTAFYWADAAKYDLDWAIASLDQKVASQARVRGVQTNILIAQTVSDAAKLAAEISASFVDLFSDDAGKAADALAEGIPKSLIAGLAVGGDFTAPLRAVIKAAGNLSSTLIKGVAFAAGTVQKSLASATEIANRYLEFNQIAPEEFSQELRAAVSGVRDAVYGMNNNFMTINQRLQELDDAQSRYRALLAEGDRIRQEREIFRQRAAAVIQGYRTRDAAFRIFRNEKLERYKALFDLSAQYAFMAAQAYDYETGLLHNNQGKEFLNRIVRSRALGIVQKGEPQFAGSNTGDPGLSSAMAEMYSDWLVLKGRLGFNNPDAYGTTVSLRTENFRILPGTNSDPNWRDVLNQARKSNILDDPDVRRYCLQIDPGNGLPVPGIVLEFSTTIARGMNLFGQSLAAGDHAYSVSSFATKVFAAGVALEGYLGMDDPVANSGAVGGVGGTTPSDPNLSFLDPNRLSATPYVYLVPVGVDSMRSPALGDTSEVRTWSVDDIAIPLPFNIGGSAFSAAQLYQSSASLSEPPFAIRKHQAFRPVSAASVFSPNIYTVGGGLQRSQWTNNRLVGRSVWNSKWKLIIPGETLLNNPDEGLERLLRTLRDVKLHFVTYSYSGN